MNPKRGGKPGPRPRWTEGAAKAAAAAGEQRKYIDALISASGGSIVKLAAEVQTSKTALSRWGRGSVIPSNKTRERLAEFAKAHRIAIPKCMRPTYTCTIDGCDKPVLLMRKGLCSMHHLRIAKHNDPDHGRQQRQESQRDLDIAFAVEVEGKSMAEVGREMNISRERVRQIVARQALKA